jgi:hypothetical protein
MLARAIKLEDVLRDLCDQAQFNKRDGVRLCRFILEDEEWALLKELEPLLGVSCTPPSPLIVLCLLLVVLICNERNFEKLSPSCSPSHSIHGHPL